MHVSTTLCVLPLLMYFITAGTPSARQLVPSMHFDAIPPHVRSLNVREERGGVYLCLKENWGPPCAYHHPEFYPGYPLCWTSMGLDMQDPYKPIGYARYQVRSAFFEYTKPKNSSIGPNMHTICYTFYEENKRCTRGPDWLRKGYDLMWYPGNSSKLSTSYWSVKCVFDDGKVDNWNATGRDFRQHAPELGG